VNIRDTIAAVNQMQADGQNGSLDPTFGPGTFGAGKVTLNINVSDSGWAGAIQSDGRMLFAGPSSTEQLRYATVARYLP
jgi:hypothetical protein